MSLGMFLFVVVCMIIVPSVFLGFLWCLVTQRNQTPTQRRVQAAYRRGWWNGWLWGSWK